MKHICICIYLPFHVISRDVAPSLLCLSHDVTACDDMAASGGPQFTYSSKEIARTKKRGTWDLQFQPPQASAFSSTAQEWCKMLAKPHSPVLRAMCLAQPHPSAPTVQCNPAGKAAPLSICTFVERETLAFCEIM